MGRGIPITKVKLNSDEYKLVTYAATACGMLPEEFMRNAATNDAKRIIREIAQTSAVGGDSVDTTSDPATDSAGDSDSLPIEEEE